MVSNNLFKLRQHDLDDEIVKKIHSLFEGTHELYGGPKIERVIRLRKVVLLIYRWGSTERVAAFGIEDGSGRFDMITGQIEETEGEPKVQNPESMVTTVLSMPFGSQSEKLRKSLLSQATVIIFYDHSIAKKKDGVWYVEMESTLPRIFHSDALKFVHFANANS